MTIKSSLVFNRNCLSKVEDFSRLQAVTYSVKVVVSQKIGEDRHVELHMHH